MCIPGPPRHRRLKPARHYGNRGYFVHGYLSNGVFIQYPFNVPYLWHKYGERLSKNYTVTKPAENSLLSDIFPLSRRISVRMEYWRHRGLLFAEFEANRLAMRYIQMIDRMHFRACSTSLRRHMFRGFCHIVLPRRIVWKLMADVTLSQFHCYFKPKEGLN